MSEAGEAAERANDRAADLRDRLDDMRLRAQRAEDEVAALKREIRYLRCYGNSACTAMAEDAMERRELEDEES